MTNLQEVLNQANETFIKFKTGIDKVTFLFKDSKKYLKHGIRKLKFEFKMWKKWLNHLWYDFRIE